MPRWLFLVLPHLQPIKKHKTVAQTLFWQRFVGSAAAELFDKGLKRNRSIPQREVERARIDHSAATYLWIF
jgi:hypothetical protein